MTLRRGFRGLLFVAAGVAAVCAFRSDRIMLESPEAAIVRYRGKITRAIAARGDVALYLPFDERTPYEWARGTACVYRATKRIPGRFGQARYFDGTERDAFQSLIDWRPLASSFTISVWVMPEDSPAQRHVILGDSHGHQHNGLWYEFGRLMAGVRAVTNTPQVYHPLPPPSRFVHVAMVADGAAGRLLLYVDGELRDSAPMERVVMRAGALEIGRNHPVAPSYFYKGAMDELIVFKRALPPDEIAELFAAPRARLNEWAPAAVRKLSLSEWRANALRFCLKAADLFNPAIHTSRIPGNLPEVRIATSSSDLRHFAKAQRRLAWDGVNDPDLGDRRSVTAYLDDEGGAAWMAPRYVGGALGESREAFHLAFADGRAGLLIPPELCDLTAPLAAAEAARRAARPHAPTRLCTLNINNQFRGVYVWVEGVTPGWTPAEQAAVLQASRLTDPAAAMIYAEQLARHAPALLNDIKSPLSHREIRRLYRQALAQVPSARTDTPALSIYSLMGSNPSPHYVTGNLVLPAKTPDGQSLAWRSDKPTVIRDDGAVTRPAGPRPLDVNLIASDTAGVERVYTVRVMPTNPPISALFLEAAQPLASFGGVDCVGWMRAPGSGESSRAQVGAIKWRGRTGLFQAKKSYTIRCEEAPGWIAGSTSRFVCLMACYLDPAFLRDRLAHDLFRDFGGEEHPRPAVRGAAVEVFMNGAYQGLYSMTERVDRDLPGWGPYDPAAVQPLMYRAYAPPSGFAHADALGYRQREPSPELREPDLDPLRELLKLTSQESSDEVFARDIGSRIDLRNFIDFYLLLNVTDNRDGEKWNFYLARDAEPGSRWYVIPWDYDMGLRGTKIERTNTLFERLLRVVPDFAPAMAARWRELRRGVLSDAALAARLDRMEAPVRPVAEWDWRMWPDHRGGPEAWDVTRDALRIRIAMLDARFGNPPSM